MQITDEIHRRAVVLGENLRGAHIAALSTALARHGRVKRHRDEAAPGHLLRVEAGGLLLHRAERPCDDDGLILFIRVKIFRQIEMPRDLKTVAVLKAHVFYFDGCIHAENPRVVIQLAD